MSRRRIASLRHLGLIREIHNTAEPRGFDSEGRLYGNRKCENLQTIGYYREAVNLAQNEQAAVIHVKDGKPITAHGAKLLGVPWKGNA